ncbi:MAG: 16S rRNA (cytosine(1402)-N(4))-methyltransferase RsmH [Acidimicrobiia bacterium]|nr:16S rRNA (cytosine(1402)-N(4))-methyltransferase RsmH [Acidimicrobiia bacterium]
MTDGVDDESFAHDPVMCDEIVEMFGPVPPGVVVDATLGGGGHADALLRARRDLDLVGIDQDDTAIAAAGRRLTAHGDRVTLRRARFDGLGIALDELGIESVVGVLFDLGVSSPQFDRADRGFSYRADGPLDMRMDASNDLTAADLVNDAEAGELASILRRYADERHAGRIARAIVAARPVSGTAELAEIVRNAIPAATRRTGGHPAKRTFQALRIAVNRELDVIEPALTQAIELLVPTGRGAVLSYHSGEDRIVKRVLRDNERTAVGPRHMPVTAPATGAIRLIFRNGRKPSSEEIERNPRAASARLRAFEKVAA